MNDINYIYFCVMHHEHVVDLTRWKNVLFSLFSHEFVNLSVLLPLGSRKETASANKCHLM